MGLISPLPVPIDCQLTDNKLNLPEESKSSGARCWPVALAAEFASAGGGCGGVMKRRVWFDSSADSNLSARQYMHDYEKENLESCWREVCNELAKEIEEDKAEIEALKSESARLEEEVKKKEKMLQLAEVWRERVQMKLIDAALLEEKYCLMSNLISELQSFLRSNNVTVDITDLSEVQVVKQVVDSLNIQEIRGSLLALQD
ncbi:hypothetical protein HAX54_049113 [Datura stramonium]|uniref:Uncharacterized protein n=1 Tax=Datura stramonium TaxID=4076 RepID=A0ABS8WNZ3_DATST|nr:hypothetical protein [Datura stramonium]